MYAEKDLNFGKQPSHLPAADTLPFQIRERRDQIHVARPPKEKRFCRHLHTQNYFTNPNAAATHANDSCPR